MWDEHDSKIVYNTSNNLFFKGIPKNISPRKVYEYFLQFGDISSCKMTEDENGSHYGYGYVTFYEAEDAKTALDSTKEKQIELFENNFIEISFFQKKNERLQVLQENSSIYYVNNMAQFKVAIYLLIIIKRILGLCNFPPKRKQKKYWIN